MGMKYFCDVCGEETKRNYVAERFKPLRAWGPKRVECEVVVAINGSWNGGIICEKCLRLALSELEEEEESLSDIQGQGDTIKW